MFGCESVTVVMVGHFVVVDTFVVYHHRVMVFEACVSEVNIVQNFIDNQSLW